MLGSDSPGNRGAGGVPLSPQEREKNGGKDMKINNCSAVEQVLAIEF